MESQNLKLPINRQDFYRNFQYYLFSSLIFLILFLFALKTMDPIYYQSKLNMNMAEQLQKLKSAIGADRIRSLLVSPPAVFLTIALTGSVQNGIAVIGAGIIGTVCMLFLFAAISKKKLPMILLACMFVSLISPFMLKLFLHDADLGLTCLYLGTVIFFLSTFSENGIYARIFVSSFSAGLLMQNTRAAYLVWIVFIPAIAVDCARKKIPFFFFLIFFFFPAFIFLSFPIAAEGLQSGQFNFNAINVNSLPYFLTIPPIEEMVLPKLPSDISQYALVLPYFVVSILILYRRFNWTLPFILIIPFLYYGIIATIGQAYYESVPLVLFLIPSYAITCFYYIYQEKTPKFETAIISICYLASIAIQIPELKDYLHFPSN